MIVLDTNVISELMRPRPDPAVVAWVSRQPPRMLYTTVFNQSEILYGIAITPNGTRRSALEAAAEAIFLEEFAGRVLSYVPAATRLYADIVAKRRKAGKPIEAFDALITATALAAGAGIATRDIGGFEGCGLTALIDPFERGTIETNESQ